MKVSYYPGCSLEGTAKEYAQSTRGACTSLDIELEEIPDWNCCGATAAHSVDHRASIELAARTLNQSAGLPHADMLVPCPMCFNRLKTAARALEHDSAGRYDIQLEDHLPKVWDLADFLATDAMLKATAKKIRKPLEGLQVVSYYGCMANRPPHVTEAADCEDPQTLDRIVENLGATSIPWAYKTDCCGASQALSRRDIVSQLVGKLYDMAQRVGAQAIVVSCQMCQANLDMYQERIAADWGKRFSFPIYYFTELIGLAHGVAGVKTWLSGHIADPVSLLEQLNLWDRP